MRGTIVGKCHLENELKYVVIYSNKGEIELLNRAELIKSICKGKISNAKYIEKSDKLRGVGCSLTLLPKLKSDFKSKLYSDNILIKSVSILVSKSEVDLYNNSRFSSLVSIIFECNSIDGFKAIRKALKKNRHLKLNAKPYKNNLSVEIVGGIQDVGILMDSMNTHYNNNISSICCSSSITGEALKEALDKVGNVLNNRFLNKSVINKIKYCKLEGTIYDLDFNSSSKSNCYIKAKDIYLVPINKEDVEVSILNDMIKDNNRIGNIMTKTCMNSFINEVRALGVHSSIRYC